ncbi:hypothetical protein SSE37_06037 [Sagittula stellata E-37]|uniref:Uncharacterized protein n=1 Tax=Sagittula stellata (strain ATCC 700073 / DSM 11524 / E-37) TaxID=388399 RepID=A3K9P8_SAGS3|nr:hypothetical protein SSE37_06037 [Sagittula stellata E-37]
MIGSGLSGPDPAPQTGDMTGGADEAMKQARKKSEVSMRTFLILALAAGLAGCGTVEGLGRDISGGARTVQSWF